MVNNEAYKLNQITELIRTDEIYNPDGLSAMNCSSYGHVRQ